MYSSYHYLADDNKKQLKNSRTNIIAGPGPGEYWNHSSGSAIPDVREEGPFPVQGHIGSLIRQEALGNFSGCIDGKSGPNCTGAFNPDVYTTENTCKDKCVLSGPESYGIQNFGISGGYTNIHGLHAYKNERAASEGTGPSGIYGCYEMIPKLTDKNNSCKLDYNEFENRTVGDWTRLSQGNMIMNPRFNQ